MTRDSCILYPYPYSEDDDAAGMPLLPTPPAPYFSSSAPLDSFGDCGRLYDDLETEEEDGGSALGLQGIKVQQKLKNSHKNRVTMVVGDYILLNFFYVPQCFCPICSCPSRTGQTVEQPNHSQQILVTDHHGHPVFPIQSTQN